jgi:hypothetical protein
MKPEQTTVRSSYRLSMLVALALLAAGSVAHVTWVEDEPRAVLAILESPRPTDAQWRALCATEGYRRLKDREAGMGRPFTDDQFRSFVSSPELRARTRRLKETLDAWARTDFRAAGRQDMRYLPANARLIAKVYPLIKPLHNSFVFDTDKDPAIMLYLDPAESQERFQRTVVHELHHIGYASCCPAPGFQNWVRSKPGSLQAAWLWFGAFGEGYAVLAAAGAPDTDPMAPFEPNVQAAWKHGMSHLAEDMTTLGEFFVDTAGGKLTTDAAMQHAREFYGVQGPWYTVGWVQATTVERAFGREKLIECYLDPRLLMPTYNAAVAKIGAQYPVWPAAVIQAMGA